MRAASSLQDPRQEWEQRPACKTQGRSGRSTHGMAAPLTRPNPVVQRAMASSVMTETMTPDSTARRGSEPRERRMGARGVAQLRGDSACLRSRCRRPP